MEAVGRRTHGPNFDLIENLEKAIIGKCIEDPMCIADLAELPKDFFCKAVHQTVAGILIEKWLADKPIDSFTVYAALEAASQNVYLADVLELADVAASVNFLGDLHLLKDQYLRRKLKHLGTVLAKKAFTLSEDPEELVGNTIEDLSDLMQPDESPVRLFWEVLNPMMIRYEAGKQDEPGVPSGLGILDKSLGSGFRRGTLNVLAARPSMGKSALALQWAFHAAKQGYKVLFVSLEMPAKNLATRIAGSESNQNAFKLQYAGRGAWKRVRHAVQPSAAVKLWLSDDSSMNAARVISLAKSLKAKHGLDLIVVDYLQRFVDLNNHDANRVHLVGGISKSFANLARRTNSAVVLVSQLSRRVDYTADKRPSLADLRDSGEIEQDADTVMLLYRPGYYDRDADQGEAYLLLEKNREGPTGSLPLIWDAEKVRFYSVDGRRSRYE
jgi:replicative DNA helicase